MPRNAIAAAERFHHNGTIEGQRQTSVVLGRGKLADITSPEQAADVRYSYVGDN